MTVLDEKRPGNTPAAWSTRAGAGESWSAAGWSERGQTQRFLAVLRALAFRDGDTLLDFGCGTGRLAEFVPNGVTYFGHDWSPAMRDRAAREHPSATVLDDLPSELFDHVVVVGVTNLADNWWKQRTWDLLADLWANSTRRTLAVSLYRGRDDRCLRYTAMDCAAFAQGLAVDRFEIDCGYLDNDVLMVLRR